MRLRIAVTLLGAGIASYGLWGIVSVAAWATEHHWTEGQGGRVLAGTTHAVLGSLTIRAAWRRVRGLGNTMLAMSSISVLYVAVPAAISRTGPFLDWPGYYLVIGFFDAFGVPLLPIGYVLAAAAVQRLEGKRMGWVTITCGVLAIAVLLLFVVLFAMSPET